MNLQGKVCLVTGGTSGIGAATALKLADKGAHVALVSRSGKASAELTAALQAAGVKHAVISADIGDPAACRACVTETARVLGRLDVLVHSGGGPVPGSLQTVTDDAWMSAFAVHVHAVFHLARAATPHMKGEGAIILLGSAAGLRGCLGALAYGVVKGALPQFARTLARELADQGIRVNCVAPGFIQTPFQDFLTSEQVANNIQNRIPLHRAGTPDDVATVIVELVQNDFITGETVTIDGGMTMRIV